MKPRSAEAAASEGQAETIDSLGPWFHNLHLPDGSQTRPNHPLGDFPRFKWQQIAPHLPDDMSGMTALDIGCNAGFYSIELARRGAEVTALDIDEHYLRQARWAVHAFGLEDQITFHKAPVYTIADMPAYDVVLFMGVFYHLRHPLLALDLVCEKVKNTLVFQTLTTPGDGERTAPDLPLLEREDLADPAWPHMAFIENKLDGDPTNWWAPTHACCEAMLRTNGMRIKGRPGHEIFVCEPGFPRDPVTAGLVRDELAQIRGAFR